MGITIGFVVYATDTNSFKDSEYKQLNRLLPYQDYMTCELNTNNIVTVVGKDDENNNYSKLGIKN